MESPDPLTKTSQKNGSIAGSIFKDFDNLYIGEEMTFNLDHDPIDLYQQFNKKYQGQYIWNFIQTGPYLWFISIIKSGQDVKNVDNLMVDTLLDGGWMLNSNQ